MKLKSAVLQVAKAAGVFALFRLLTRKQGRILCYHGGSLGDEHLFNGKLFCHPAMLRQRLDWLKSKGFVPAGLDQVATPGAAPRQGIALAITLDDGWYSSEACLLPLLAEYGHEPVLYLHTGLADGDAPVSNVALRYLVWKARRATLELSGFCKELDGSYQLDSADERERLSDNADLWFDGMPRDAATVTAALERFAAALGIAPATLALDSRRFSYMRREELHTAAARGCKIELHGHFHRYFLGDHERNQANIEACRRYIVDAGLPRPHHYCYPSGSYDAAAARTLAGIDVRTGTTCIPGLVRGAGGDERYFLPRFLDGGNVTMIEFEAEMSGVLEFARKLVQALRRGAALATRPALLLRQPSAGRE
ncbi:polysaccharide deacetylase family protein [Massilia niastensis]|uniref:polysaccharide deacetylase family protein n=1 Tax=Massilia niastensis TaxID=544911 RepID=UPI00035C1BE2|nr:polysaccharide deacetylase family protein [Massilia niastensis]